MINIQKIRIQIQMLIPPHLHRRIRRPLSLRTRRELQLRKHGIGRQRDARDRFGAELFGGRRSDEHFLDQGVRGLCPGWC